MYLLVDLQASAPNAKDRKAPWSAKRFESPSCSRQRQVAYLGEDVRVLEQVVLLHNHSVPSKHSTTSWISIISLLVPAHRANAKDPQTDLLPNLNWATSPPRKQDPIASLDRGRGDDALLVGRARTDGDDGRFGKRVRRRRGRDEETGRGLLPPIIRQHPLVSRLRERVKESRDEDTNGLRLESLDEDSVEERSEGLDGLESSRLDE
jgi:hypothetical protein